MKKLIIIAAFSLVSFFSFAQSKDTAQKAPEPFKVFIYLSPEAVGIILKGLDELPGKEGRELYLALLNEAMKQKEMYDAAQKKPEPLKSGKKN